MRAVALLAILLLTPSRSTLAQQCRADFDGSGAVEVNELIAAVNEALGGCGGGNPTPTRRTTPTRTPTRTPTIAPVSACPYKFNNAVTTDRFCGYFGPTTSRNCGDLLPSASAWTTEGTDVYAILADETGSVAVIGTRSNATTVNVHTLSPGPDFNQFFNATGSMSLPSNTRFTVTVDIGANCGRLTHTGTFDSLLGDSAVRASAVGLGALGAVMAEHAAAAAIPDGRAVIVRRLVEAMRHRP